MNNDNKPGLKLGLTAETAKGTYANLAVIAHSPTEFVIDFACMMPNLNEVPVVSRMVMTPENTKRLLFALQDNLQKYEAQFGPIQMTKVPNDMPPFMPPGSEA